MYKTFLFTTFIAFSLVACEKCTEVVYIPVPAFLEDYESDNDTTFKNTINDHVFFSLNSSKLSQDAKKILDKQRDWLNKNSNTVLIIEGHADERGSSKYNLLLSQSRADAVKNYLVAKGIFKTRIRTVSFGKEHPETLGHNEDIWSKNRSAVTIVHKAN